MHARFTKVLTAALWLPLAAAAAAPPGNAAVLATVAGEAITAADLQREMAQRPGQYATPEERRTLLDAMVRERSLVAAARAAGYDHDPKVVDVMERMMVARLHQDRIEQRLENLTVSDEEVAAYYAAHQEEYARPARSQAAIVFIEVPVVASDEARAEARERAEKVRAEAAALPANVRHFGKVALRYSDDRTSRYQGGVIGWLVEHNGRSYRWDPAVVDAVFSLAQPGDISPVIETEKGFYVVRLVDREDSQERPLEMLAAGIRRALMQERRHQLESELETQLTAGIAVEVDEAALAEVPAPESTVPEAAEPAPPQLPAR